MYNSIFSRSSFPVHHRAETDGTYSTVVFRDLIFDDNKNRAISEISFSVFYREIGFANAEIISILSLGIPDMSLPFKHSMQHKYATAFANYSDPLQIYTLKLQIDKT